MSLQASCQTTIEPLTGKGMFGCPFPYKLPVRWARKNYTHRYLYLKCLLAHHARQQCLHLLPDNPECRAVHEHLCQIRRHCRTTEQPNPHSTAIRCVITATSFSDSFFSPHGLQRYAPLSNHQGFSVLYRQITFQLKKSRIVFTTYSFISSVNSG